jgi:hypothetical protein
MAGKGNLVALRVLALPQHDQHCDDEHEHDGRVNIIHPRSVGYPAATSCFTEVSRRFRRGGNRDAAVELGASLAGLARRRLAAFRSCSVVTGAFEDWEPQQKSFDAVVVFNALHWIDPGVRYAKPAALLRPGGAMVKGSCRWSRPADAHAFWTDVRQDYHAVGFAGDPPPPEAIPALHFPAEAAGLFEETASLRYPIQVTYRAEDYLAQLATQSGTQALGAAGATEFLSRVRRRLESLRMPSLTATFVGLLAVGRRSGGR